MSKLLGLDIDSAYIRMSLAERKLGRVDYLRSEGMGLTDGGESGGAVVERLRKWSLDYGVSDAVVGLPLRYFTCKLIDMPAMSRDDLRRALLFELEKHLPLGVEDYYYDFLPVKTGTGNRTLVLTVRKDTVQALLKPVREAGLNILSVRCRVLDVLNSLIRMSGQKSMMGVFVLAVDDAFEMVGFSSSGPVQMKRVPLDGDLAGTIDQFRKTCPGDVYCSGQIDQLVADRFAMKKSQITVANALIFSFGKKTRLSMEFVSSDAAKPKKDPYPLLVGALALASLLLYLLTGVVAYFKDARQLSRIETRIDAIKRTASGAIEARKKLETLQDDRNALFGFHAGSNRATRIMKNLTAIVPDNAWLINMAIDEKGGVEIEGFSKKTSDLVAALDKSKMFRNISFAAPVLSRDGEERFSLKFEVSEP